MTDQQNAEETEETIEVDPNHPWLQASLQGGPSPVPTGVQMYPVELTNPNGSKIPAALLTVVTPTGVQTVFMNLNDVQVLLIQGATILQEAKQAQDNKLVIAKPNMVEDFARHMQEQQAVLRKK